jgi:peptidoglycan/xylan/chitin deacetylase (PgdA/CDA1 family)
MTAVGGSDNSRTKALSAGRARGRAVTARPLWKGPIVALLGLVMLGWSDEIAEERAAARVRGTEPIHAGAPHGPTRPPIHGTDFPDGVVALTWDDGPDAMTLELARFLRAEKVSGSFFVVGEWIDGISEEPGVGENIYETGYQHMPVLADLVALGHRVGSHTENHALLSGAAAVTVAEQIGQSQHEIDPFLGNELRMFRAPGGAWGRAAAAAIAEPFLADLVGPFHWDIDGKDWENSLYCRSKIPSECEPGPIPGRTRVRPEVTARRYLTRAESMRRGIVLMHDRVGHVGSRYALDVARHLVPELEARGFVFGPPLLAFGPLTSRLAPSSASIDPGQAIFADVDGDGRDDLCREDVGFVVCAHAAPSHSDPRAIPRATLETPRRMLRLPSGVRAMDVADIDGDGRADVCVVTDDELECALAADEGRFAPLQRWSAELTPVHSSIYARSFRLADVDGDGRADACARSGEGILCATSTGQSSFGRVRVWLGDSFPHDGSRLELADLDGDGRADVCASLPGKSAAKGRAPGVACALSNAHGFGPLSRWSVPGDLEGAKLHLGDLNGDGRADVCAGSKDGIACAFSGGRGFKHSSIWSDARVADVQLADLNGDGRWDLCAVTRDRVDCGLAP